MIQALSKGTILWRSLVAIILTGVLSPLLLALGAAVLALLTEGQGHPPRSISNIAGFVGVIWVFGSLVATGCALLLGLFVEYPKMKWLMKSKPVGWTRYLLMSIGGAEILIVSLTMISVAIQPPAHISDIVDGLLFVTFAAAIGGACSAAFWWKIVALPVLQARAAS